MTEREVFSLSLWFARLRCHEYWGAGVAVLFVVVLLGLGLNGIARVHGFCLAGG